MEVIVGRWSLCRNGRWFMFDFKHNSFFPDYRSLSSSVDRRRSRSTVDQRRTESTSTAASHFASFASSWYTQIPNQKTVSKSFTVFKMNIFNSHFVKRSSFLEHLFWYLVDIRSSQQFSTSSATIKFPSIFQSSPSPTSKEWRHSCVTLIKTRLIF